VLATAGFGSRRNCEQLILDGRVEVNREVTRELGRRIDQSQEELRVDGVVVKLPKYKYFVLHKPVGVVSTARDPWARTRVIDLVEDSQRVFTVGRLDISSSGLILLTNDGDLAHQLTHPKFGVEKLYKVLVAGKPTTETLQQLRRGVYLAEGKAHVEHVTLKRASSKQSALEIVLAEGRNREIRRLLARVGHKVQQLKRVAFGPIRLGELPVGAYRELTRREVQQLREAVAGGGASSKSASSSTQSPRRSTKASQPADRPPKEPKAAGARKPKAADAGKPKASGVRKPKAADARKPKTSGGPRDKARSGRPEPTSSQRNSKRAVPRSGAAKTQGTVLGAEDQPVQDRPRREKSAARVSRGTKVVVAKRKRKPGR
jgi:23S rRNA pseudouridine2605 synthase